MGFLCDNTASRYILYYYVMNTFININNKLPVRVEKCIIIFLKIKLKYLFDMKITLVHTYYCNHNNMDCMI